MREADTEGETLQVSLDSLLASGRRGRAPQVVIGFARGLGRPDAGLLPAAAHWSRRSEAGW